MVTWAGRLDMYSLNPKLLKHPLKWTEIGKVSLIMGYCLFNRNNNLFMGLCSCIIGSWDTCRILLYNTAINPALYNNNLHFSFSVMTNWSLNYILFALQVIQKWLLDLHFKSLFIISESGDVSVPHIVFCKNIMTCRYMAFGLKKTDL